MVARHNELDQKLYEYASQRLSQEIQAGGAGLSLELQSFRYANQLVPSLAGLRRKLSRSTA